MTGATVDNTTDSVIGTERSVTFLLTPDDYVAGNRLYLLTYYLSGKCLAITAGLILVVSVLIYLFVLDFDPAITALSIMAGIAVYFGIQVVNYLVITPLLTRRRYRQQKTLHYPTKFSWSDSGFAAENEQGRWQCPWTDFFRWSENARILLVYPGPGMFYLMPRRVLTSEQISDLRRCISTAGVVRKGMLFGF